MEAAVLEPQGPPSARRSVKTSWRLDTTLRAMEDTKRATIYFDARVHRALRLKAAACNRSISDMVNEAVSLSLAKDADDLADVDQRQSEQSGSFDAFVTELRRSGRL